MLPRGFGVAEELGAYRPDYSSRLVSEVCGPVTAARLRADDDIRKLAALPMAELARRFGRRAARRLAAAFELARMLPTESSKPVTSSRHVLERVAWMRHEPIEHVVAIYINARSCVFGETRYTSHSHRLVAVQCGAIARDALLACATSVALVHNHPSGDAAPSADDRALTQTLKTALRVLNMYLVDHIIVAGADSFSFLDAGHL